MHILFDDEKIVCSCDYVASDCGYYLFKSKSGVYPFVRFEEDIYSINDYCFLVLRSLKAKLNSVAQLGEVKVSENTFTKNEKDFFESYVKSGSNNYGLLKWCKVANEINKQTILVMLLAFLKVRLMNYLNGFANFMVKMQVNLRGNLT